MKVKPFSATQTPLQTHSEAKGRKFHGVHPVRTDGGDDQERSVALTELKMTHTQS